jgi:hypothetical protein
MKTNAQVSNTTNPIAVHLKARRADKFTFVPQPAVKETLELCFIKNKLHFLAA